jgi:7-cyano-7-deazaguanine synthase
MFVDQSMRAVVLLSGGLDSATVLALAKNRGYECFALTFHYGQRHECEIECAKRVAVSLGVAEPLVINLDLRVFGGSALTDDIDVPEGRLDRDEVPATYVPARNTIFLSLALAYAEVTKSDDIFIGVNALDYSGYPDCRPEFINAFQNLANVATKAGVEGSVLSIHAPLIEMTKSEIINLGTRLGVDYSQTISCYSPIDFGLACGHCDACLLRKKGFAEAGVTDPTRYATYS